MADAQSGDDLLAAYRASMPVVASKPHLPDEIRRQLQSLGYLGGDEEEAPKR